MSMFKYNELLRSAYQIAQREGKNTNWEAFINNVRKELLVQAGLSETETNENYILRATITPKTYRVFDAEFDNFDWKLS